MSKTLTSTKTLAAKVHPFANNAQREALGAYGAALQHMQSGRFDEALAGFAGLGEGAPPEVRERAMVYRQACQRQIEQQRGELHFQSLSEQYDYAVACINNGDYEEARDQLEAILTGDDRLDYVHYGLSVLHGITGQAEGCLHHLERAIVLNPHCRVQARSDVDFRPMADDPRFTELLYPEAI